MIDVDSMPDEPPQWFLDMTDQQRHEFCERAIAEAKSQCDSRQAENWRLEKQLKEWLAARGIFYFAE